ncbi:tripartite tricarboxylate transporter TctB family protein [Leptothrix discophora]|uniref:Tripartite tricarboxylate transporter TctB family protein n=1 Tax=Leptothrix discophora TaxID=89 RepID=A0ABT9G1V3_LEPDI|nr:tripartite tricarboxylate transporter TctB family protein [Leptothrix discophora]MDP4300464.1 tripartite tricarboxylate transporter TctB family protein [Leptothrix discophora]
MQIKSQKDFWSGLMFIVVGIAFAWGSLNYSFGSSARPGPWAWRPLIIMVVALVLFGLALPRLGLLITLPLLVFIVSLAGDEFHWKDALLNATILTGMSWVIFVKGLSLTIPVWPTVFAAAAGA